MSSIFECIYYLVTLFTGGFYYGETSGGNFIGVINELVLPVIQMSPGLLLFVLIPFVGLGIGLIKRIIKLN